MLANVAVTPSCVGQAPVLEDVVLCCVFQASAVFRAKLLLQLWPLQKWLMESLGLVWFGFGCRMAAA